MKGTKLDLLIFRRPTRLINEFRNLMTIGLLRDLYNKTDKDVITQYHDDEPYTKTQARLFLQPVTASISRPPKRLYLQKNRIVTAAYRRYTEINHDLYPLNSTFIIS